MSCSISQTPILPPTITDQIRLWELERDRFKFNDGVLYNQFLSQNDFELLRDYAKVRMIGLSMLRATKWIICVMTSWLRKTYWITAPLCGESTGHWMASLGHNDTLGLGQDGRHCSRRHFQMQFCSWKCFNFDTNFTEICSQGYN